MLKPRVRSILVHAYDLLAVSLSRCGRRVGFSLRHVTHVLSALVTHPALLAIALMVPALLSSVIATYVWDKPWPVAFKCLLALLPIAVSYYIYLRNLSPERRAAITVRMCRHSDARLIRYLCRQLLRLIQYGDRSRRRPPSPHLLAIETAFVISRATLIRFVVERAAPQFRLSHTVLEGLLGLPMAVVERRAQRRLSLSYHLHAAHRALGHAQSAAIERQALARYETEARTIEECVGRFRKRLTRIHEVAPDAALILRTVAREASTGQALVNGARILAQHVGTDRYSMILSLLNLRAGIPLKALLAVPEETATLDRAQREAITCYLMHLAALQYEALNATVERTVAFLRKRVPSGGIVLTVGFSQVVALALTTFARERREPITIGVVAPERDAAMCARFRDDEDARMVAELLAEPKLRGRVVPMSLDEIEEAQTIGGAGVHVMLFGAQAVSPDGTVIHPRGRLQLHQRLTSWLADPVLAQAVPRIVVCESYKVLASSYDKLTSQLVSALSPEEYEVLIADLAEVRGDKRNNIGWMRRKWLASVGKQLNDLGYQTDFLRQDKPPRRRSRRRRTKPAAQKAPGKTGPGSGSAN
jgi:hypothetical protein